MFPVVGGTIRVTVALLDGALRLRAGTLPTAAERGKAVNKAKARKG